MQAPGYCATIPLVHIEKVSYAGNPERVTEEAFDCVWVRFLDRKAPSPIVSQVLQWMDWRLQGTLSRHILGSSPKASKHTTFLPTMNRIGTPLVAIDPPGDIDWESFSANCKGMNIKRLLILCEEASELSGLEKDLRRQSAAGLEKVILGSDGPVGRG